MEQMPPRKFKGRGRGILALRSWSPLPRPDNLQERFAALEKLTITDPEDTKPPKTENQQNGANLKTTPSAVQNGSATVDAKVKPGQKLVAKYNYRPNPDSPLSGPELLVKQGEKLEFVEKHDDHWWLAKNQEGQAGFVPASYMMVIQVTSLPWLQNREPDPIEEQEDEKPSVFGAAPGVKKYRATYKHEGLPNNEQDNASRYYCEVCDKQLNGPQPYKAHMASKAHKEEVELKEYYQQNS